MNNAFRAALLAALPPALLIARLAPAQMSYADGTHLLAQYHCQSCHALDRSTAAGPSLRDIARRYASDPNAVQELGVQVHNGSSGVFGAAAMPPMDVPDADLEAMIKWILKLPLQP